jgi:hypothetical protein
MNSLTGFIKSLFSSQASMLGQNDSPAAVSDEPKVWPDLSVAMYNDLGDIGVDRNKILDLISRAFPEGPLYDPDIVRHNRRALYKSIQFLRTLSKRAWVKDAGVTKGEYTEDKLTKNVARIPQGSLRAV